MVAPNFYGDTALLLRFQGANGTTSFTDESPFANTVSTFGDADIQDDALDLDGSGDYLTVGDAADFNFLHDGTKWTIELWVVGRPHIPGPLLDNTSGTSANFGIGVFLAATGELRVLITRNVGAQAIADITSTFQIPDDSNTHHIVIEYDWGDGPAADTANSIRIGYDGGNVERFARGAFEYHVADQTRELTIGRNSGSGSTLLGQIRAIRITRHRCLYDLLNETSYTAPTYDAIPVAEVASEPIPQSTRWYPSDETNLTTPRTYSSEPHLIEVATGEIVCIHYSGPSHDTNSTATVALFRSTDYGKSFLTSSRVEIATDASFSCRNPSVGYYAASSRLIVFYRKISSGNVTQGIFFRTSTDKGATWSAETEISSSLTGATTADKGAPFGRIIETSNGLMAIFYKANFAEALFSTDGGLTWGSRTTIYDVTGTAPGYNEPWMIAVTTNDIVAMSRRDGGDDNDFAFYKSSNGGTTWSFASEEQWTGTTINVAAPGTMVLDRAGNVLTVWAARSPDWQIRYTITDPEDYIADPGRAVDGTETLNVFHTMRQTSGPADSEFGYPALTKLSNGQILCAWYEGNKASTDTRLWQTSLLDSYVAVGIASEADTVPGSLSFSETFSIGIASETNTALPVLLPSTTTVIPDMSDRIIKVMTNGRLGLTGLALDRDGIPFVYQDKDDVLIYTMDYSDWLNTGTTITAQTNEAEGLTVASVAIASPKITFTVSGVIQSPAEFMIRITDSLGQKLTQRLRFYQAEE